MKPLTPEQNKAFTPEQRKQLLDARRLADETAELAERAEKQATERTAIEL